MLIFFKYFQMFLFYLIIVYVKLLFLGFIVFRHNDFPLTIRELYQNDLSTLEFDSNLTENELFLDYSTDHTDLPRLRKGKVGGQVHQGKI